MNQIFIQARIGSTRLPAKVLKKITNKTIIEIIIERLKKVANIDKIILVTGPENQNKALIEEASRLNVCYFCGNEENVLDRFYKASQAFKSENIVRITADCPFVDYNLINKGLEIFNKNNFEVLSNVRKRTFPHGFDFEIFKKTALETAWLDKKNEYKEKFDSVFIPPTQYMLEKKKFKNYDLINEGEDLSKIRLTLDYPEDFELITKVYETLYSTNKFFVLEDILLLLRKNPDLLTINQKHVVNTHNLNIEQ